VTFPRSSACDQRENVALGDGLGGAMAGAAVAARGAGE
jgi:hypothetical protein